MNRNLTLSQRVHRAVASTEIEVLMATHAYLHGGSRAKEEWTTIWSTADDVSWAHDFGRMRGFHSVWMGSVGDYDAVCYQKYIDLYLKFPEIVGKDPRPLYINSMHTLSNGIIEVADDGQTGRASYLTPGLLYDTFNATGKRWSCMLWERYGADFRWESGRMVYLHDQVAPDFECPFDDENLGMREYDKLMHPENYPVEEENMPTNLEDPGPLHVEYRPTLPIQHTVDPPKPYGRLDNDNSYTYWEFYNN